MRFSRKRVADGALVVNASPLIVLAKIGRLPLLDALGTEVIIPEPVALEVLAGEIRDPARVSLEAGYGSRLSLTEIPDAVIEWSLGAGESSVIATCLMRPGSTAVLDDAEARACARTLRVPLIGTLGIVARARVRGLIPAAATVFADLRAVGLFLDDAIVHAVLRGLGEEP